MSSEPDKARGDQAGKLSALLEQLATGGATEPAGEVSTPPALWKGAVDELIPLVGREASCEAAGLARALTEPGGQ